MNLIERYPTASAADLRLYFLHTLIWAKPKGAKQYSLLYVHEMIESPAALYLWDFTGTPVAYALGTVDVDIRYPEAGFLNWRSTAVHLTRLSHRQNQKGICRRTVQLHNLFGNRLQERLSDRPLFKLMDKYILSMHPEHIGESNLRSILISEEQMTPVAEAWNRINLPSHPTIARAISRQFALSKGVSSEFPSLWFDGILVGHMPHPRRIVMSSGDEQMFQQEVRDCFEPQGIEVSLY